MATQPDEAETGQKSRAHLWFVAFSLKWLMVTLQALPSTKGVQLDGQTQGSALLPQSFPSTLGTVLGTQACQARRAGGMQEREGPSSPSD